MSTLHDFIPQSRARERDEVATVATAKRAFELARHFDLARSPVVHALYWLRTLPERLVESESGSKGLDLHLDAIGREGDGFMVLEDSRDRLIVGAIGRFWKTHIEFAQVDPSQFAGFSEPGWGKVAWQLSSEAQSSGSRLSLDLAVTATDDESWHKFRRYYRLIGPFSRAIRRYELRLIARELGGEIDARAREALPGDDLIRQPKGSATDTIVIDAPPSAVWPWLVQMGRGRAGWYSYDMLDNGGIPSASEVVPELQSLKIGDVLPTSRDRTQGFTVIQCAAPRVLVLGSLYDIAGDHSLPIDAAKPQHFWQSTWAFALEPTSEGGTRLSVRARVDYAPVRASERLRARMMSFVHHFMEQAQLKHLKARVEGRYVAPAASLSDVADGARGAIGILYNLATPFLRDVRCRWGLTQCEVERDYPGDGIIAEPRWQWTHAIEIYAPPSAVWPWVAQLGQERAGFYSYQALENLTGCEIRNADRVHGEWQQTKPGDSFRLHPKFPALEVRESVPEQHLLVCAGTEPGTGLAPSRSCGRRYVAVTWLFRLESLANGGTRLVSRYRCACSGDLASELSYGPYIVEAVGFTMDRRMLIGIKERVESNPLRLAISHDEKSAANEEHSA